MSMSEAMDVMDEFHIKRSDYDRVEAALDVLIGEDPEEAGDAASGAPGPDEQMAAELFAPGRDRKAM